ncbi:hypothetical protein HY504_03090 [Candidatus Wolfebacteria bacterium]|nr:hypothetical protein [Candidatus Wolfebacteria bacterium]
MHVGTAKTVKSWAITVIAVGTAITSGVLLYQWVTPSAEEITACEKDPTRAGCEKIVPTVAAPKPAEIEWSVDREVVAPAGKWSDWHTTPSSLFRITPEEGRKALVEYSNGVINTISASRQRDQSAEATGRRFRVMSPANDSVTVFLFRGKPVRAGT